MKDLFLQPLAISSQHCVKISLRSSVTIHSRNHRLLLLKFFAHTLLLLALIFLLRVVNCKKKVVPRLLTFKPQFSAVFSTMVFAI